MADLIVAACVVVWFLARGALIMLAATVIGGVILAGVVDLGETLRDRFRHDGRA